MQIASLNIFEDKLAPGPPQLVPGYLSLVSGQFGPTPGPSQLILEMNQHQEGI